MNLPSTGGAEMKMDKLDLKTRILRCITAAFQYLREAAQRAKMSRDLGIWVLLTGDKKPKSVNKEIPLQVFSCDSNISITNT
jgi:hypothetical protein